MIDIDRMKRSAEEGVYRNVRLDHSTHFDGCEYYHYPCAILALCAEIEEYRATYKAVLDDKCADDEEHCTCVPFLRERIATLEKAIRTIIDVMSPAGFLIRTAQRALYEEGVEHDNR